ncbi:hypothetical protein D3C85_621450 [compost metagenome]
MSNTHPPVLIFTIEGRPVTIWNVGFMPSCVFSPYAEYEEFVKEVAEVQHSPENFCTWMMSKGLGDYLEPELIPENVSRFLSWDLIPTAKDFGDTFDIIHRFPTVMTQHLLEQLASGWRTSPFQAAQFSRDDYFRFLREKAVSPRSVEDLRTTVVRAHLHTEEDQMIAEHGYTMNQIFDNESGVNFVYTVGLTAKAGLEVIAIAALGLDVLSAMVAKVADSYVTSEPEIVPGYYEGWAHNKGGQPVRFQVTDVVVGKTMKLITNTRGQVKRVLQVLIADQFNILPTEEGYDKESVEQPVLMQLKDIRGPSIGIVL